MPTQQVNQFTFLTDFYKFCRTLRLKIFFQNANRTQVPMQHPNLIKLKKKSSFDPVINNAALDVFQQTVINKVTKKWELTTNKHKKTNNITRSEFLALKELCKDDTIVTKKADKGGATVLMDRSAHMTADTATTE